MHSGYYQRAADLAGADPLVWERLTWNGLQQLREQGEELVVLPVGATEQHGPHLPVSTDTAIATAVCAYGSARARVPVLPTLSYGVSVGHTEHWPGTVSLLHETLALSVREIVGWLVAQGWRRIILVNSHFGNHATLSVAVDRLRFDYRERIQIGLVNSYALTPEIERYFTCDGEDIHANRAETDLMLYLDPEACDMAAVQDDPDRTEGKVFSYLVPATSKNGVTGRPSEGTAERGRELLQEMGEALTSLLIKARSETAPIETPATGHTAVYPFSGGRP
jgi:creatinine amidohydrolase